MLVGDPMSPMLGTVLELLPLWQFELHGQTLSFLLLHLQSDTQEEQGILTFK